MYACYVFADFTLLETGPEALNFFILRAVFFFYIFNGHECELF